MPRRDDTWGVVTGHCWHATSTASTQIPPMGKFRIIIKRMIRREKMEMGQNSFGSLEKICR